MPRDIFSNFLECFFSVRPHSPSDFKVGTRVLGKKSSDIWLPGKKRLNELFYISEPTSKLLYLPATHVWCVIVSVLTELN